MQSDRVPSYRRHKQSGQAIVTLTDGLGGRKDILLGKWKSKGSRDEYKRVIAEWLAAGRHQSVADAAKDITINELSLAFIIHAKQHYRRADGTLTNEFNDLKLSLKPLWTLYGHTPAGAFGPLALETVRKAIVTGSWMDEKEKAKRQNRGQKLDCSRGVTNQRVGRIRRMFRWAASKQMVPVTVYQALLTLDGLKRGRCDARETAPVKPVAVAWVEATLPYLLPMVADMVRLQLLSGARPGEIVIMRAIDIDTSGSVWLYRPGRHKMEYRGGGRVIPLGPRAQEIVRRYLRPDVSAYLFSAREAVAAWRTQLRQNRKSKVQPSQQDRSRRRPKVRPGDCYTTNSYACAIKRGVLKANVVNEAQELPLIPHWHPHQLRHTKATEIRREAGLDAARAVLGHRSPQITETYAEIDMQKAVAVAAKLG
jgi:integrase